MPAQDSQNTSAPAPNAFTARDVTEILREQGWLLGYASPSQLCWCERAAALLGPHAGIRSALADLLRLVFHYNAREVLAKVETHAVISRQGARDVLRHLALLLLEAAPLTPERFKQIIEALKVSLGMRSRDLFHPIRLALAGRVGDGELDRVILLLDEAAVLPFALPVKSARQRILEFCAALD